MHLFVSDLHMTDADIGGVVTDAQLTAFANRIEQIAVEKKKKITVVFAGDILELLRSRKWDGLWNDNVSPWSGMGPKFENFGGGPAEECAMEIADAIRKRYAGFSARLKDLAKDGKVQTKYLYGNHDYMVQLSPELRKILIDILVLEDDPQRPFPATYSDESSSVFATHGHAVDRVNWHDEDRGFWAMGDAIVLRILNRFASEASAQLGVGPATRIGRLFQDIENIDQLADIPLYVRWLAETSLSTVAERNKVEKVWTNVVREFLALDSFRDETGYGRSEFEDLRQALWFSTHMSLAELLPALSKLFAGKNVDYRAAALVDAQKLQHRYRFILYGHTHQPGLTPLKITADKPSFYVNTGCWKRVVARAPGGSPISFIPRRLASYFQVDEAGDGAGPEHYHLYQEWHAT